jgi:hypothetical protein
MHLLFIDESGTPPKPTSTQTQPHFVIAGLAMPAISWKALSEDFKSLKNDERYRIVGEIKWRHFGERNKEAINNVSHLNMEQRFNFRSDMFKLITKRAELKIIACISHAPTAYTKSYIKDEEDLYEYTYKPVTERFQYLLQEVGPNKHTECGIIISDHRGRKQDERLRKHHQKLVHSSASNFSSYDNFVETLFLAPSHQSVGVQFADMIAGAIGRYFNSKDQTFAKLLLPAFRTGPSKKILGYGLVKFPSGSWEVGAG